jgi:hypothetical protein
MQTQSRAQTQAPNTPIPYPATRENPETKPCVKKVRGNNVGVREAAKKSVPTRRPQVENERHSPLLMNFMAPFMADC